MQITITGKQFDPGKSLKERITLALTKVVHKYFDHAVDAHVTISKENHFITLNLEVHIGHNIIVRASDLADEAYLALDQAIRTLEQGLRRYKERLKAHHSNHDVSKEEKAMQYVLGNSYRNFEEEEETHKHDQPAVIAETTTYIPHLSVSEAIMRLDLSDSHAFLFKNKSHGQLNLVYMRKDGNIGWVDPEGNKKLHENK
ncbi:MAG: ribosomal subunit interface protein [Alphaproteobacteria bacterium RIFCSPHIGHO2_01_FULL_41_14]|nr:MAG: ribosomal subunit interface protein [Alphaproteobacteria bacterium GWB1_45_5]OFW76399.1 MAG: ribosomal subunit interface protein [Alphaproteobacteria bacterium GWA1_45_9]OFW89326.1 MAG: ribosomal subunit interface protein [Alphaproteobacteria bacterium RIFCSPHIGHO2_01_FULL_41_14]